MGSDGLDRQPRKLPTSQSLGSVRPQEWVWLHPVDPPGPFDHVSRYERTPPSRRTTRTCSGWGCQPLAPKDEPPELQLIVSSTGVASRDDHRRRIVRDAPDRPTRGFSLIIVRRFTPEDGQRCAVDTGKAESCHRGIQARLSIENADKLAERVLVNGGFSRGSFPCFGYPDISVSTKVHNCARVTRPCHQRTQIHDETAMANDGHSKKLTAIVDAAMRLQLSVGTGCG
jgi:hypothetical protein